MIERIDETIVAISSPPGRGRVGIVRLSGPRAIAIAGTLLDASSSATLARTSGGERITVDICFDDDLRLPGLLLAFKGPRSYTRQDLIEIHTVGSPPVLEMIRDRAIARGALAATPGEFTARAFLSGAMDLAKAEAVAATIHAESDMQLRAARRMKSGAITKRVEHERNELAKLLALVEADIDFAEEPIDFIKPDELSARLGQLRTAVESLATSGPTVEQLSDLPHVLLFGPPNAGKSTLMNRLSGMDRAICSAVSGTTRDVLSAPIKIGRGEAILLDAAGIDRTGDSIIVQARTKALLLAEQVDLVCLVVDASAATTETIRTLTANLDLPTTIVVANKCDLLPSDGSTPLFVHDAPSAADSSSPLIKGGFREVGANADTTHNANNMIVPKVFRVSALNGTGIEELRRAITTELGAKTQTVTAEAILLTERQRRAVLEASASLARASDLAAGADETIDCADLLAFELREALEALGCVTGEITTEDLLAEVFANFCIGK